LKKKASFLNVSAMGFKKDVLKNVFEYTKGKTKKFLDPFLVEYSLLAVCVETNS
jgi:hypothetical protein